MIDKKIVMIIPFIIVIWLIIGIPTLLSTLHTNNIKNELCSSELTTNNMVMVNYGEYSISCWYENGELKKNDDFITSWLIGPLFLINGNTCGYGLQYPQTDLLNSSITCQIIPYWYGG